MQIDSAIFLAYMLQNIEFTRDSLLYVPYRLHSSTTLSYILRVHLYLLVRSTNNSDYHP